MVWKDAGSIFKSAAEYFPQLGKAIDTINPEDAIIYSHKQVTSKLKSLKTPTDPDAIGALRDAYKAQGLDDDAIAEIMKPSKAEQKVDDLLNKRAMDETLVDKAFAGGEGTEGVRGGIFNTIGNYYKAADRDGDMGVAATRIGTTVGASMLGGTMLRGGSLTRNEYGERDIAGIPII